MSKNKIGLVFCEFQEDFLTLTTKINQWHTTNLFSIMHHMAVDQKVAESAKK